MKYLKNDFSEVIFVFRSERVIPAAIERLALLLRVQEFGFEGVRTPAILTGLGVLIAAKLLMLVFRAVASYGLVGTFQSFKGHTASIFRDD
jgi:hypothetical protein